MAPLRRSDGIAAPGSIIPANDGSQKRSGLDRCTCGKATGGMAGAVAQRRERSKHSRSDEATPTYVLWPNGSSKGTGGQVFLSTRPTPRASRTRPPALLLLHTPEMDFTKLFSRSSFCFERPFTGGRERLRRNRRDDAAGGGVLPPVLVALARRHVQHGYALGRIVSMPASLGYDDEVAGPKVAQHLALRSAHRQT